ncbi:hypothetical protein K469DRAFT_204948 [Zopfia rhizophila CBS 207.26]|uniref:Uncharacterized protein n=1 Tax=Zopfia rhizophila CBS 207.26 TaxID=1314779 RepID=A0A6A6E117_9PEZI|nr:hypothetical protein K469DRAFT_204948 [Zopfia rhizophila CBS 207.26]
MASAFKKNNLRFFRLLCTAHFLAACSTFYGVKRARNSNHGALPARCGHFPACPSPRRAVLRLGRTAVGYPSVRASVRAWLHPLPTPYQRTCIYCVSYSRVRHSLPTQAPYYTPTSRRISSLICSLSPSQRRFHLHSRWTDTRIRPFRPYRQCCWRGFDPPPIVKPTTYRCL